jgi:hypothetical protein
VVLLLKERWEILLWVKVGMSAREASLRVKWVEVGRFVVSQWVDALLLVSIFDVDLGYSTARLGAAQA